MSRSLNRDFELLEPYAGKLARTVLRGEKVSNGPDLPDMKLIFVLSDTQDWLNLLASGVLMQVPMKNRKRLMRKTYYLPISSLAHILERHHIKVPRHPGTGKFTIPVPEILSYLRDIAAELGIPLAGSLDFKRTVNVSKIVGFDQDQLPTTHITVLTDAGGRILTAFPGIHFVLQTEINQE